LEHLRLLSLRLQSQLVLFFFILLNGTQTETKMDLFFGIGNFIIGLLMTLICFKIYNPFKGKNEPKKEEKWYQTLESSSKVGGIALLVWGVFNTMSNLN